MTALLRRPRVRTHAAGAIAVVAVFVVALLLATSVSPGQLIRFCGYHALFVVLPGWIAYRALVREPGDALRQAVFGWALGYVLEILAFWVTAAIGARGLIWVYPPLVIAAGLLWRRRRPAARAPEVADAGERAHPALTWGIAAVCIVALVYVAAGYFTQAPLPWRVPSVVYYTDLPFDISLVAEARHHWPITNPGIAGLDQRYQNFVFMDMASAAQVAHLPIPLVVMRLYLVPLFILSALGSALAARSVAGRALAAPIGAGLMLLVGELDPDPSVDFPFNGSFFADLYLSPTFLLGLALFLPVLTLVGERLAAEPLVHRLPRVADVRAQLREPGPWLLLLLLLVGCAGAKATLLPVLGAALGLFAVLNLVLRRAWSVTAGVILAGVLVVFVASYVALYSGHASGTEIRVWHGISSMLPIANVRSVVGHRFVPEAVFWVLATVGGLLGLFAAPLAGLVWLRRRRAMVGPRELFLLCVLAIGIAALLFLFVPGDSQLYFVFYGYAAGVVLSAAGLAHLVAGPRPRRRVGAVLLAAVLAVGLIDIPLDVFHGPFRSWRDGTALYQPDGTGGRVGLTAGTYAGMTWLRDHSSPADVIAVNNHFGDTNRTDPRYFYYSAFAERRVYLESWLYNGTAYDVGYNAVAATRITPFPKRYRTNEAAFAGDPRALAALRRAGVRYLFADRRHGTPPGPRLAREVRQVYANADCAVYAL